MRTAPAHRTRARRPVEALLAIGLLLGLVPTVAGASSWTFGTPTADSTFDKGIVFSQPIEQGGQSFGLHALHTSGFTVGASINCHLELGAS
jgi:TctA family transporter